MFSYFGSKSKLVKLYPKPIYDTIVEPFCGSARYALEYFDRNVIINDINPKIVSVWHYLKHASKGDILSLPVLKVGDHIDNFNLTDAEKWLIGFELCRGKFEPRKVVNLYSNWSQAQKRIADNVWKIKHWEIKNIPYQQLFDYMATWFIDSPYKLEDWNKHSYPFRDINYQELAQWCKDRQGQVIVCGGTYDDWLPFENLKPVWNGLNKLGYEKVYYQG